MTIEEFIQQLKITGVFESFNTPKPGQTNTGAQYKMHEKKIDENTYQLTVSVFSTYNWRLINQLYHFADVYRINNNTFHFSRNMYANGGKKSLLSENIRESIDNNLPNQITLNNETYSRKQFGYDFFYFNEELPDNTFIDLNDHFKMIKIKCTQIGGIYVPSKTGKRYFMITDGIIYCEGLQNATHYNVMKHPKIFEISADDIMIMASINKLLKIKNSKLRNDSPFEDIRNVYVEKMTSKLLKLD